VHIAAPDAANEPSLQDAQTAAPAAANVPAAHAVQVDEFRVGENVPAAQTEQFAALEVPGREIAPA